MNLIDFRQDVLETMEIHITDFDSIRAEVAYRDVINLFNLMVMFDNSISDLMKLLNQLSSPELSYIRNVNDTISTLHKALIDFANIFTTILIHEARQRPVKECTIGNLAEQPLAKLIDADILHRAYCLYMYRNKLVTHHEKQRVNAHLRDANGARQLFPAPYKSMKQDDIQKIQVLKTKFSAIAEIASENNPYELLNLLYYKVPSPHGDKTSQDRHAINEIAERGGCRSMSQFEVIKTIDDFSLEIARIAPIPQIKKNSFRTT